MKDQPSIRKELLRTLFGSLVLLYAFGSITVFLIVRQAIQRQFDELLHQKLQDFAEETRFVRNPNPGAEFEPERVHVHDFFDTENCVIRDYQGEVLKASTALDGGTLPFRPLENGEIVIEPITLPNGKRGRIGFISFQARPWWRRSREVDVASPNQRAHLSLAMPTDEQRETLQILALTLLGTGAVMGAAIFLIVRRQVEKSYRPIDQLVDLTDSIQPDQLAVRLPCTGLPGELAPLVHQFNTLLDRLETAFIRERSFSASLAHEIRTPLAELGALLENAVLDAREDPPSENPEEIYRDAEQIFQHMNRLIEVISSLHQVDSGRQTINIEPIDPGPMLEELVSRREEFTSVKNLTWKLSDTRESGGRIIDTDKSLARAIFQNLLSNAASYSRPGTEITCQLKSLPSGNQVIEVRNTPGDLDPDDVLRISEPFWQKDEARTRTGRFGLGLAMVEGYAGLLGAEVSFELRDDLFTASVQFPA